MPGGSGHSGALACQPPASGQPGVHGGTALRREKGGTGNDGRRTALAPGDRGASFAGDRSGPVESFVWGVGFMLLGRDVRGR